MDEQGVRNERWEEKKIHIQRPLSEKVFFPLGYIARQR